MSQQTLINIRPGDDADADVIDGNFKYLDKKSTDIASSMTTLQNNVNNQVNAKLSETLSIYQDVVQPKNSFSDDATTVTSGDCYIKSDTTVAFTPTGNCTFHLPSITGGDVGKFHQILVQVKLTNASYVSAANTRLGTSNYFNQETPVFTTGTYDIMYEYDNINNVWVVGNLRKG